MASGGALRRPGGGSVPQRTWFPHWVGLPTKELLSAIATP